MGILSELAVAIQSGYGWLFVTLLITYELFAPTLLDKDTALAPLVRDLPDKVDKIDDKQDQLNEDVNELKDRSKVQMQVQRAQARANPQMDADAVDAYLLHNGVEPAEFIHGDEMGGYANWNNPEDENSDEDQQ